MFSGPRYDENSNRLNYFCLRCGYRKKEAPNDHRDYELPPNWPRSSQGSKR